MQRQLQDVIQSRYGVSSKTSNQVIQALTEIEKRRQGTAVGLPGRTDAQQTEPLNIESIVGDLFGSRRGGLLGLIIYIIGRLLFGGRNRQSSQDVTNILGDLMGGATHSNQAPDLANILLGLLGTGSGSQSSDVEGLVTSLLSGQGSSQSRRPSRRSR
jgi:hypothetical protein